MGQYAGWSFEQLFEQKNGCIQANRELELELHQLDWSDREGRDDIYATLDRNVRTIAAVEAEIEERRARQATVPASSRPESGEVASSTKPAESKAAELFRRGSHALAAGWLEDAVRDLSRAVSVDYDPYHAQSWFNLAVAQQRNGDSERAAEGFMKCVQYSIREEPALAATASLRAAELWRSLGQTDKSAELLRDSVSVLARCAELHLALAVHHGEVDHLRPALELAPLLAEDARAAGSLAVEAVSSELCKDPAGPPARLWAIEKAASTAADTARSLGLSPVPDVPPRVQLSAAGVDRLVVAAARLPSTAESAVQTAAAIRQAQKQLDGSARTARASGQEAEVRAARAEEVVSGGPREIYTQSVPSTATLDKRLRAGAKAAVGTVVLLACLVGVVVALGAKSTNEAAGHTGSGQGLLAAILGIIGLFAGYTVVRCSRELANMRTAVNKVRDNNDELKRASQEEYRQQQQNAAQARKGAEHARRAASEAERVAQDARSALERPLALMDAAIAAATSPARIVPFALPEELALEP